MEQLTTRIKERGGGPNRADIAELLASIGKPGEKQDEKRAAVEELYKALGLSGMNIQRQPVWEALNSWSQH